MAISAKEGAAIGAGAALLGPWAPVGVATPLLFGAAGAGLAKAFGKKGEHDYNWYDPNNPLQQTWEQMYPGLNPNLHNDEMTSAVNSYLSGLTNPQMLERYKYLESNPTGSKGWLASSWSEKDRANYAAYKSFKDMFGRDPSSSEYSQILPAFQGPNGDTSGRAAVAQYYEAYKQSPEYLKTQAPKYSGDVNQVFNDLMKRGATQGELDHFGQMLATGQTDLYELSQYVQSLPEYQTAADTKFRSGLANELQGYDTQFFKKTSPEILDQYTKAGIQNSSALDYAMADLMGNIASKRGEYLSGLSAQQYGGNKEAARQDYQTTMNNYLNTINQNKQRTLNLQDYYNQRGDQGADYSLQRNDYMNYLNSMQKQNKPGLLDYVNTGANLVGAIGSFYN